MIPIDDDDELRRRLTSLRSDVDRTGLPGPSAARRRAAQRTRNQITTGVAAGVAVVALGGLGIAQVLGAAPDRVDPAPPPTTAPSTTEPSPTPTAIAIPDNAYLTIDDIQNDEGETWQESDAPPALDCFSLGGWDTEDRGWRAYVDPDTGSQVFHELLHTPNEATDGLFAWIVAQAEDCTPDRRNADDPEQELPFWLQRLNVTGVGQRMWATVFAQDHPDRDDLDLFVDISVMQSGDLTSLVIRTKADTADIDGFDVDTPANAAARACNALFGESCVNDPQMQDAGPGTDPSPGGDADPSPDESGGTDPDPTDPTGDDTGTPGDPTDDLLTIADDPFLSDGDLNPIGSYGDGWRLIDTGSDAEDFVMAQESGGCVDPAGSTDATVRGLYSNDLEGYFTDSVLQFGSTVDAAAYVEAHASRPDSCSESTEPEFEITLTGPAAVVAGDAAYAWHLYGEPTPQHPGTSTSFTGAAVAHRGNIVVVLTFGSMSDPLDDGWAGWAESRLDAALDAAIAE